MLLVHLLLIEHYHYFIPLVYFAFWVTAEGDPLGEDVGTTATRGISNQRLLHTWTDSLGTFFQTFIIIKISKNDSKIFKKYNFSQNLEGVAQKLSPPRPFQFWTSQGCGSLLRWAMPFIFSTERVPIEVNKWWKFGDDISNHFWEIEIWRFFFPPSVPHYVKK